MRAFHHRPRVAFEPALTRVVSRLDAHVRSLPPRLVGRASTSTTILAVLLYYHSSRFIYCYTNILPTVQYYHTTTSAFSNVNACTVVLCSMQYAVCA